MALCEEWMRKPKSWSLHPQSAVCGEEGDKECLVRCYRWGCEAKPLTKDLFSGTSCYICKNFMYRNNSKDYISSYLQEIIPRRLSRCLSLKELINDDFSLGQMSLTALSMISLLLLIWAASSKASCLLRLTRAQGLIRRCLYCSHQRFVTSAMLTTAVMLFDMTSRTIILVWGI